jgi:hypothetical protein
MEYLKDQIIDKSSFDNFGHLEIAKEISQIINSHAESDSSLTIGIFGKWGLGKSSILTLLKNEVLPEQQDSITYFDIPIWKYNDRKSIRRKFIYQIAKKLCKEEEINNLYNQVTTEINETYLDKAYDKIKLFVTTSENRLLISFIILILAFIIYSLFRGLSQNILNSIVNYSILFTLVSLLIQLIQVVKFSKTNITKKVYEGEEQFEHKFEELLVHEKGRKIFLIDDLDRCESSKILAVFEVIKNFLSLPNCVFIIACDPNVIKAAIDNETINNSEATAQRANIFSKNSGFYLEKIFQYIIDIPEFMSQNMREYAKYCIITSDLALFKESFLKAKIDSIIFILVYKDTFNPRKVKSLINRFILSYKLAIDLELSSNSFLTQGTITDFPERLAFVTVIKSEFPEVLEKLKEAPSLGFKDWASTLAIFTDFMEFYHQNIILFNEEWAIAPYIYFNNDPSIKYLPQSLLTNATLLSNSLRNGNFEKIEVLLLMEDEIFKFIEYTYNQIEILSNEIELLNAIKIFINLFKKIDYRHLTLSNNCTSEIKIETSFRRLITLKEFENDGLTSYLAYNFHIGTKSSTDFFTSYLEYYVKNEFILLKNIFSDKYFSTYDVNAKQKLLSLLEPTPEKIRQISNLIDLVTINDSNYGYFKAYFTYISEEYRIAVKNAVNDESQIDYNIIKDQYLQVLKHSLNYSSNDFTDMFTPELPLDEMITTFEGTIKDCSNEKFVLIFNGIIQILEFQGELIIQEKILNIIRNIITKDLDEKFNENLDLLFFNEFNNQDFDLSLINDNDLTLFFDILNTYNQCLRFQFSKTRNLLYEKIDLKNYYEHSKIILEWLKKNSVGSYEPSIALSKYINILFNNPTFLVQRMETNQIVTDFFEFIEILMNRSRSFDFKNEFSTTVDAKSTFFIENLKQFSNDFIEKTFNILLLSQRENQTILPQLENIYYYLISNYKSYSNLVLSSTLSNLIKDYSKIKKGYKSDAKEIIALHSIYKDQSIEIKIRQLSFILRFLLTDAWWPTLDIKFLTKEELYSVELPKEIRNNFNLKIEKHLLNVIIQRNITSKTDYHLILKILCKALTQLSKYHSIDNQKLCKYVDDSIDFYKSTTGNIEEIKSIYDLLLLDFIHSDSLIKKGKFANNLRTLMKRYTKIKKTSAPLLNGKFDLKISSKHFK